MTHYRLYYATATAGDGVATLDIQFDGTIVGVQWIHRIQNTAGSAAGQRQQLSFGSSNAFSTNDARQVISEIITGAPLNAAACEVSNNIFIPLDMKVNAGERIYMHQGTVGTIPAASYTTAIVMVEDKNTGSRFLRT